MPPTAVTGEWQNYISGGIFENELIDFNRSENLNRFRN